MLTFVKKYTVKKEPITSRIKNLVHKYGGDNAVILDKEFVLIYLLGFSGVFRIEELLEIKLKHVQIKESIFFFSFHSFFLQNKLHKKKDKYLIKYLIKIVSNKNTYGPNIE